MNILASALYNEQSPFTELFNQTTIETPEDLVELKPDALVIWGGEDISPKIYGQKPAIRWTSATAKLSIRDKLEIALANQAVKMRIPIIGICRGAQLMCALSGGSLIQHVSGHGKFSGHLIVT